MPFQTADYIDVTARARELGIRAPVGIALLPGNFPASAGAAELRYHRAAPHVRSAWRSIGLVDGGPGRLPRLTKAGGPDVSGTNVPLAVFFGAGLLSGPAGLVTLALGAVAAVLTVHPGSANSREIRFDAVVERPDRSGYTCLEYHGDAYELVALAGPVRSILAGNRPGNPARSLPNCSPNYRSSYLPSGSADCFPDSSPDDSRGNLHNCVPSCCPESRPSSSPDSRADSTTGSLPDSRPRSSPDSSPNNGENSLLDSSPDNSPGTSPNSRGNGIGEIGV